MKISWNKTGLIIVVVAFLIGVFLPISIEAGRTSSNLSVLSKDYVCSDSAKEYHFYDKTYDHNVTIDCPNKTVTVYLENATIDMQESNEKNSEEKPAIRITKNTHAVIYLVGSNVLEGGNNTGLINKNGYAGIQVDEGASVTILGNGSLTVKGGGQDHGAAGIGASYDENCGMITIGDYGNCPTIIATGGDGGAGIGGAEDGDCKKGIYIMNGKITATGKNGGAGIGAGDGVGLGSGGNVDTIIISGGTITATGGNGAAGIGGSDSGTGADSGNAYNITISQGTVKANGGEGAAGIGGGRDALVANICIYGGNITATGGKYGAGIGGGNSVSGGDGGDVNGLLISGGTIIAKGGESAAGIGGGDQSIVTDLKITESAYQSLNIIATGGKWGAGIGNGNSGLVSNNIDNISINLYGGKITATGGSQGAGIGGGNSTAKNITITGIGEIVATGYDESCAIGSGECETGGNIHIEGMEGSRSLVISAKALATSGRDNDAAVIGSADCKGGSVTIKNATVYLTSVEGCFGAGIGAGKNCSMIAGSVDDITIENCYIKDNTSASRNAASIGAGWSSAMDDITIKNSSIYGGTIGGTDNGNEIFDYKCIDAIKIENSTIEANNKTGQRAGIGSGRYSGVGNITITDSNITATTVNGAGIGSGGYSSDSSGDPFKWLGCDASDITIIRSVVTATGAEGGAGIGGGWGNKVGEIKITDSNVTAVSGERGQNDKQGGAGIGGGYGESVDYVSIVNSTVTATGKRLAAGIGSGGMSTIGSTLWNTSCGSIYMLNSKVTATGGYGAAGIGTGYGAQFFWSSDIYIKDCEVTATGGGRGAGIGAGANGALDSGGEAPEIKIEGKSKVTAKAGEGAAGIGGGYCGGCDGVIINLLDTKYSNGEWLYYVEAFGGAGAAGIGSGAIEDNDILKSGFDIDKVEISGGYVYAKGGDDVHSLDTEIGGGAGAGIGGGSGGGKLKKFHVSGGYVVASAGNATSSTYRAFDIGSGGNDLKLFKDNNFKITGGTVIGNLSSEPDEIIIDGGSVSDNLDNAERSDGTRVYRTQMKVEKPYYEISNLKTSLNKYGTNDIFSDGGAVVYLYLPASGNNASTADFESYHYYGTTKNNGAEWIKRDLDLKFKEPESDFIVGYDCVLKLDDSDLVADIEFVVEGDCVTNRNDPNVEITSPGAQIRLRGNDFGEFKVIATASKIEGNMYWDATAVYNGKITKSKGTISYVECLSKIYDGQPVANPTVKTNSDGEITYKFYENGVYLGDGVRPVDCGTYYVIVSVAGTENYSAAESNKMYFEISTCWIAMEMTATETGTTATVEVELFDPYNDPGEINLSVNGGTPFVVDVIEIDGRYVASHTFDTVVGDSSYIVTASYNNTRNYKAIGDVTKTFDKSLDTRTITVEDIVTEYGSLVSPTSFNVTLSEGTPGNLEYEVVYDFDKLNHDFEDTISVNPSTGEITYHNAGIAYVKITMTDDLGLYDDAVAYAKVIVTRKSISVSSYAYLADDLLKTPVSSVEYGKIDTLAYGLKYGGLTEAPNDFITVGELEPLPINNVLGVNDDARIAIAKISGEIVIGGETYEKFISRNYSITFVPGSVDITPATLKIKMDGIVGLYGKEPEYTYTFGEVDGSNNLMPWDASTEVVNTTELVGGQQYENLQPSVYDEIITANVLANPNYIINVEKGDLRITKGLVALTVKADSKVYDQTPLVAETSASAIIPDGVTADIVKEIGAVTVKYYKINDDGTITELTEAPTNVGHYYVKTTVAENDYYLADENTTYFSIFKAKYDVDTPKLNDIYIHEGLSISEQLLPEGWEWYDPSKNLEVGPQYGFAVYTPQDSENYFKVVRKVNFNVLETKVDNDIDVNVGYSLKITILKVAMINSLAGILLMYIYTKKKK